MQRSQYQVARLRGRQGQANGFQITHLTDQYDVGVLAQGRAQGLGEAQGVAVHFALVEQAPLCSRAQIRSGPQW